MTEKIETIRCFSETDQKLLDEQNTMQGILSIVIVNRSFKKEAAITTYSSPWI